MTTYTYSPQDVTVLIAAKTIKGYSKDSLISVEPDKAYVTTKRAADGYISRQLNKTGLFKMTISLAQTSDSNDFLGIIMNTDRVLGDSIFPVLINDHSTGSVIFALNAWITKQPAIKFTSGIETREWELALAEPIIVNSGGDQESVFETFVQISAGALPNF